MTPGIVCSHPPRPTAYSIHQPDRRCISLTRLQYGSFSSTRKLPHLCQIHIVDVGRDNCQVSLCRRRWCKTDLIFQVNFKVIAIIIKTRDLALVSMARDDPLASSTANSMAAVRPQCAVKWYRNLKPKLAIMRQCTSVTDRRTDRACAKDYRHHLTVPLSYGQVSAYVNLK